MEAGIGTDKGMANYLCMNIGDRKQLMGAHVLQMITDHKEISKEQLQSVLTYIREVNIRAAMYQSTLDIEL